jgi:2-polyprenyl-3-methyl-5-hydroxy-6-metoxy-1,4-benzoquinol methylase
MEADKEALLAILLEREARSAPQPGAAAPSDPDARRLTNRLFAAALQAAELMSVYIGVRLGLYEELGAAGRATAPQLAARANIAARYAREWLEQQSVADIVRVDQAGETPDDRVYSLSPGHRQTLDLVVSPHTAALVLPVGALGAMLPRLLDAYRSGDGVPEADFGIDMQLAHAASLMSRSGEIVGWIKTKLPALDARLGATGAHVVEIGGGVGWFGIALAQAYPQLRVDVLDTSGRSMAEARGNAIAAGVAERIVFAHSETFEPSQLRAYDLAWIYMLHDIARPVEMLRKCRSWCAENGYVLVRDMKVAETFTAPGTDIDRFIYASSVLHCLCVGLVGEGAAGTGSAMRPSQLKRYAIEAGFSDVEILPIENTFNQLYRLR